MNVEEAPDGWFIERNGRYYHINQEWLDEMYRHQVKPYGNHPGFNQLKYLFETGETDPHRISEAFKAFYDNRSKPGRHRGQSSDFYQWIKEKRAEKRNRSV